MVSQEMLQRYARLAVRTGANVQEGQLLILTASPDCAEFARMCAEEAYKAGAGEVQVNWEDEQTARLRYEYESTESLCAIPEWSIARKREGIARGCCYLYIES
ncbi:MAG: aminopeptidase, partial [Pseudoflavonifractor sp.]